MSKLLRILPSVILLCFATGAKAQTNDGLITADTTVYSRVDVSPHYKGGDRAFGKYLEKKLKYPLIARKNFIQGRVILTFVVEKNGKVTNVHVKVGVSPEIDAEAIRLIEKSPELIPGKLDGKPVRTLMNVPLDFKLEQQEGIYHVLP